MTLSVKTLVRAWEEGRTRHPIDRALLLRALEAPDADVDALADEPLGERNAALLRLRLATFGSSMRAYLECPQCAQPIEFDVVATELLQTARSAPGTVEVDGLSFRPPTSRDLVGILGAAEVEDAALLLLQRCLVDSPEAVDAEALIPVMDQVEAGLEEADPMAEFTTALSCGSCGHGWSASFDIAEFLWEEIDATVRRLLDEVHLLARAYGWTEETIFGLSETRRAAYVERVLE